MTEAGSVHGGPPRLALPDPGVVVLCGPAGCGKSSFAARHFAADDVLSSDTFRGIVAGDPGDQSASAAAFALLRHALDERAKRRRFTVVDATSVTRRDRSRYLGVARKYDLPSVAIAFDLPLEVCQQRAADRLERVVTADIVERQHTAFRRHLDTLGHEGFDEVVILATVEDLEHIEVTRHPAPARTYARTEGTRPPAVIVDLDGTLTSAAWREHFVASTPRNWKGFFAGMSRDAPVQPLVDLVEWVGNDAAVVLLTGRPDDHETVIRRWLADHGVPYDLLLMRARGDRRPDTVVKRERYHENIAPHYDVRFVIDDRPRVIEMWREEGLYVLTAVDPRLEPLPDPTAP